MRFASIPFEETNAEIAKQGKAIQELDKTLEERRIAGKEIGKESSPPLSLASDDDEKARFVVQRELSIHPEIDTLFVSTAGILGAVEGAVGKNMLIFTSDDVIATRELIRSGRVQWTICQEPYRQGYESIRRMQDYLIDGRTPDDLITENIVRIKENLLA